MPIITGLLGWLLAALMLPNPLPVTTRGPRAPSPSGTTPTAS